MFSAGERAVTPSHIRPRPRGPTHSQVLKITLGVVLGGLVLIIGCSALFVAGEETVDDPTVNEPTGDNDKADDEGQGGNEDRPQTASVGDTLTLKGFEGLTMDVTLTEIDRRLEVEQEFDTGNYVGVRLTLTNTGEVAYDDSPSNGATLVTKDDQQLSSTILFGDADCSGAEAARIAPGDTRKVCVVFEREEGQELRLFQFALDSGFAEQTGEWTLE
jgi:hypothetical protein